MTRNTCALALGAAVFELLIVGIQSLICVDNALASYADVVLSDNPVCYYRFEETVGTTANDSSGNGNNGTYVNGVLLSQTGFTSQFGTSAAFDGINDYVDTPRNVAENFTLEAWINTTASGLTGSQGYDGNGILWSDVADTADDFVMAILNNALVFFTGNPDTTVSGGPALNDGTWHHLVATRTQGGNKEIYVDGVLVGSTSTNSNPLNGNPNIFIGGNTLDSRYLNGYIDEVAYYSTVLSRERISAHYMAAAASVPTMNEWGMIIFTALTGLGAVYYLKKKQKVMGKIQLPISNFL
ncbi:MAG: IPTL-CTERM sorting domain-containing protein [Candidatus Schekmanbacteria bacterium]|nr:IPTL-CTERM sorting domain-containing protein [Candidatus Schekmanbacteria bacterium]